MTHPVHEQSGAVDKPSAAGPLDGDDAVRGRFASAATVSEAGARTGADGSTSSSADRDAVARSARVVNGVASRSSASSETLPVPLPRRGGSAAPTYAAFSALAPAPQASPSGGGGAGPRPASATIDPLRVLRQYAWWLMASVVLGVILGVAAHLVLIRVAPSYTVAAYFEVNPPVSDSTSVGTSPQISDTLIERQMNTQAAIMTQPSLLEKAINSRKVRETRWLAGFAPENGMGGPDLKLALRDLEERISAQPERDSFHVRLAISGPDPDDMLPILDAVKDVYLEQMEIEKQAERQNITDTLRRSIDDIVAQLARVQREIENRVEEKSVDGTEPLGGIDVTQIEQVIGRLSEARQIRDGAAGQLAQIRERMENPPLVYTATEREQARLDPKVAGLETMITQIKARIRADREHYGEGHAQIERLEASLRAHEQERDALMGEVLERNLQAAVQGFSATKQALDLEIAELEQAFEEGRARLVEKTKDIKFIEWKNQEGEMLRTMVAELESRLKRFEDYMKQSRTNPAKLSQAPIRPISPSFPQLKMMVPVGVVLCSGLCAGFVFIRELTDKRIKGPGDLSAAGSGRVLGVIPDISEDPSNPRQVELLSHTAPNGVIAESIRQIRNPVIRQITHHDYRVILMVGAHPGSGTTAVISNLAVSFGRSDRRVLMIDANFRRPRLHSVFGMQESPGLGDVLSGRATVDEAVQESEAENVWMLPAGSAEARIFERLGTDRIADLVSELRLHFDIILIDAPAAVAAADCQMLANISDASMLVVRAMREQRGLVARLSNQLRETRAAYLGVILNGARSTAGGYIRRNIKEMNSYQQKES